MKSTELKQSWTTFFEKNDHFVMPSKSLIPQNDDSILWINSGVATLKPYFTGEKTPPKKSLVSCQKSIRTNDIENVGITARHHTFFEMLGNFSIGGYFKETAIALALQYLLGVLKLDKNKIYITYFEEDSITKNIWLKEGIKDSHIIAGNKKTNFWDIGSGPCGPNTEIFYDRGEKYDPNNIGIKLLKEDIENDRYIEIWNIVFSEFNNDGKGNYPPLAQKNIDTGAGFERLLSILQDVPTNYDTDLFVGIIKHIERISGKQYVSNNYFLKDPKQKEINKYFKIIADHIRTATLAINDGASPSNVGRGYIIRRIIRRAYRTGLQLGIQDEIFLYRLVKDVASSLKEYNIDINRVSIVIETEEKKFAKTIHLGEKLLKKSINEGKFNDKIVFKLFETYGFPIELTSELASEHNLSFDIKKVQLLFKEHQNKSKSITNKGMSQKFIPLQEVKKNYTDFVGYDSESCNADIMLLFNMTKQVKSLRGKGMVISSKTPFYATKGGQSHDIGIITQGTATAKVIDVFSDKQGNHVHVVEVDGELKEGKASFQVDHKIRADLERNHTGTHLVYSALRSVLGIGIFQLGSDNNQDRLKFDFPLDHLLTSNEISKAEEFVNKAIQENIKREYILTTYSKAKAMNALGLPKITIRGEVRVVKFGNVSIELCGGTHVLHTSQLEKFLIIKVESKGSGIYRVEALTSNATIQKYFNNKYEHLQNQYVGLIKKLQTADSKYKTKIIINPISSKIELVKEQSKIELLLKEYKQIRKSISKTQIIKSDIKPIKINNIELFIDINNIEFALLKTTTVQLRDDNPEAIIALGVQKNNRLILTIASQKYDSHKIIRAILNANNGKGGGNKYLAQGSCDNVNIVDQIKEVINAL